MSRLRDSVLGPDWGIRSMDGHSAVDSPENRASIARTSMILAAGFTGIEVLGWLAIPIAGVHVRGSHYAAMLVIFIVSLLGIAPAFWLVLHRFPLWVIHLFAMTTLTALVVALFLVGPVLSMCIAIGGLSVCTIAFLVFQWRVAVLFVTPSVAGMAAAFAQEPADTAPWTRWIVVTGGIALIGGTVAWLVSRAATLAAREHAARQATAELNRTLERRVAEQVSQLDRMVRLRRFLSQQVADKVLASDSAAILEPHREQIAVIYCDLRGFTRFSAGAEPEDVLKVIDAYYQTVGEVLRRYDATVGNFAGDGIMAYLNDPVPCDDPAYRAVCMALELQAPMAALTETWRADGNDLGYGIGITYGYATLGMIGFEGRHDYSAVGAVVNLAARLCDEAGNGEILIDGRAQHAVRGRIDGEPCTLILKGIPDPVTAYLITAQTAAAT